MYRCQNGITCEQDVLRGTSMKGKGKEAKEAGSNCWEEEAKGRKSLRLQESSKNIWLNQWELNEQKSPSWQFKGIGILYYPCCAQLLDERSLQKVWPQCEQGLDPAGKQVVWFLEQKIWVAQSFLQACLATYKFTCINIGLWSLF